MATPAGPVHGSRAARTPEVAGPPRSARRSSPAASLQRRVGNTAARQLVAGDALEPRSRAVMEASFGHDFSTVRVRDDAQEARVFGAQALTRGEEIVLGEQPTVGLLAHELAHVVQQRRGGGAPGVAHEAEAEAAARTVEQGGHASVALGSVRGGVQRAGPMIASPKPPAWLNGLNTRHVQDNIWEVEFKTGGWHFVGPYDELDAFRKSIGLKGDSHHIVGGEHLLDLDSSFKYEKAPAVVLDEGLHEVAVTPRIGYEQAQVGGRRGGRPALSQAEVKRMYRAAYTEQAPLRELSKIADNIVDQSTPSTPPGGLTKAVTGAAHAAEETPAINVAGKAALAGEKQFVAGEKSAVSAIKPGTLAAEEKLFAKGGKIEAQVSEKGSLKGMGLKGGPSPIKLAVAGMGIQIAGGLLQSWMHDKILESVKNMPKPTITAARIWTDPASRERYVPVEILAANLPQVQEDLELSVGRSTVQLISFWRELELAPQEQRTAMLDELEGVLYRDQADVLRAQSNVWRALELEPQILESVEAARDLQEIVSNPMLMGLGVSFVGFNLEELTKISDNLSWFQASFTRGVLRPLHGISEALARAEASNEAVLAQIKEIRARAIPRVAPRR